MTPEYEPTSDEKIATLKENNSRLLEKYLDKRDEALKLQIENEKLREKISRMEALANLHRG